MRTLVLLITGTLSAAGPAGMDPARLARIPARMQQFVDSGTAAGIVTLLARHGETVHLGAAGFQDREARIPMRTDSIFQIASMTKPVTAIGIMILMEEGRLSLADPVEKHLPDFKGQMVRDGATLRKPSRLPTIRDLMTHTSGLGGAPAAIRDIFAKRDRTLAEAVALYSQTPLEFDPGTHWMYSNTGIATLGRIIEVLSGQPYQQFLLERIFKPLGMKDSFFFVTPEKKGRIAAMYSLEKGKLERAPMDIYRAGARYPAPEGGLYSTAADLAALYQMMLNRGAFKDRRILSPASVDLMTRVHTGDLEAGFAPGIGYGLAWSVVKDVRGMFRLNSIGTYGHGGAWRTYAFIDPLKDMLGILLMQRISPDGDMADEISAFSAMSYAAILE
jgi:CubicO group peptidase (beta-lactamase class C family)